jgi:hypothetical protein
MAGFALLVQSHAVTRRWATLAKHAVISRLGGVFNDDEADSVVAGPNQSKSE